MSYETGKVTYHFCFCQRLRIALTQRPSVILLSYVRPSVQNFKHLFLQTAWLIKAKFCVESPWVGGTKVCSWNLGHMTRMATTPIYGKPFQKSSSPEPVDRFPRNLVRNIGHSCSSHTTAQKTLNSIKSPLNYHY